MILRNIDGCAAHLEASLRAMRVDSMSSMSSSASLAVARHILGEDRRALESARLSAEIERRHQTQAGFGSNALSLALAGVGEMAEAKTLLTRTVREALDWGIALWLNEVLVFCAAIAYLDGDAGRASRLFAAGRELGGARSLVAPFRTQMSYALYLHYLPRVREVLGAEEARKARDEGRAMTADRAVAYALEGLES
jgi:hypothetical protein